MALKKVSLRAALVSRAALTVASAAVLTTAFATACTSDSGGNPTSENLTGRGPITYVEGKDTTETGVVRQLIDRWNAAHPDEQVTYKEQSNDASQQYDDLVEHMRSKSSDYDVFAMDVPWTAEFAAKGWIQPLKDSFAIDTSALLPPTVASATYNNTLYAAPRNTNGGLLFYRTDLVPNPPKTWDEMLGMCNIARANNIGCYAGQLKNYEGLTVNTAEVINAYGGTFVGSDGKTPTVDSPQARAGLGKLVEAYDRGDIPPEAVTFTETESGAAFTQGKLMFLRSWPSTFGDAGSESSVVRDKFAVAPLPGESGIGASTLGGYNAAISAFSKNKATALDFLRFLISEDAQHIVASGALPSVRESMYDDPALIAKMPYLPALKDSISNAVPRPVTPFYPAVSKAIRDNAFAALKGEKSVDDAIIGMQKGIEAAG
ncbi:ABC transporter substrate-binding protein [Nocardia cyriacigeorgica]|uniref:Probable ABC transporter-binding protein DR_1438 n=1 Tax=Nocardia cyriacigeorgica TaxID=135487 RepID=A0A4U8W380_9NOCA|nr:ABC transporter substrate-binding protein [Nocardia cyriacigeorgica]MBF6099118.1 ABC transporter substrate-binding protein [Nocardia cyriacigeorgica]MBF6159327.1 ABC transporter substrate-binding protein [Nocardia cyriacigeorgica]MBF6198410.1 ABC transporter substrate-binding protein [Nocardia cyriacigeorgica]MBF6315691.1 ABC transporter substrate-binding protein [Nocardia cyriacigeorgica]MBF6342778.1 ABC transporter substrate-binding protein [Nocardia cyriacigeorgica]